MIIFDLDGTLADCEHRRYHVDASKRSDCYYHSPSTLKQMEGWYYLDDVSYPKSIVKFKPDWKSFYEACDKDQPIYPVIDQAIYWINRSQDSDVQIWSGRSESVYQKTFDWLVKHGLLGFSTLRMRPVGNSEPDEVLKEMWLNECINGKLNDRGEIVEFVFDDRPKVIRMWRRRGIFVFNCAQHDEEF